MLFRLLLFFPLTTSYNCLYIQCSVAVYLYIIQCSARVVGLNKCYVIKNVALNGCFKYISKKVHTETPCVAEETAKFLLIRFLLWQDIEKIFVYHHRIKNKIYLLEIWTFLPNWNIKFRQNHPLWREAIHIW